MNEDLKMIKKKYGEKMSHLCRELFPTLLEEPGLLAELLLSNFHHTHFLYDDLMMTDRIYDFKSYIYSLSEIEQTKEVTIVSNPHELLEEAGYLLYECKTEEDIQKFRKYYAPEEELCTFHERRLNQCHVFFAVKKDVDKINRVDFPNPHRQDIYGTSVISIQFTKDQSHTLSIKNRYNHKVDNPDSTFSNNLDNIIPGLTKSFENTYGLVQKYKNHSFEIPNYVRASDGKYYKYNYEINNIYYCPDNIIIDNFEVKKYNKSEYLILDYFILDLKNKMVTTYDQNIQDGFSDIFDDIDKMEIEKDKDKKVVRMIQKNEEECIIELDKENKIIGFRHNSLETIGDRFLWSNNTLLEFNAPCLKRIGDHFLFDNNTLLEFNAPCLERIGDRFLCDNNTLLEFNAPCLKRIGDYFLCDNNTLLEFNAPCLERIGDHFLCDNNTLLEFNSPYLEEIGNNCLCADEKLSIAILPSLEIIGSNCFSKANYCVFSYSQQEGNIHKVGLSECNAKTYTRRYRR